MTQIRELLKQLHDHGVEFVTGLEGEKDALSL